MSNPIISARGNLGRTAAAHVILIAYTILALYPVFLILIKLCQAASGDLQ